MASPIHIVAYMALFTAIGFVFLFATLLAGRFLRPHAPNAEKLEVYECGEPTIGSSFVQFDLRFYVVALLFIIFDVEVAFFFPWATVFGKTTHMMDPNMPKATAQGELSPEAKVLFMELGVADPTVPPVPPDFEAEAASMTPKRRTEIAVTDLARRTALFSMADIAVFFSVLLVGFAYVWKRGDLDWVRALSKQRAMESRASPSAPVVEEKEPVLS
ncbi:MAG: NADH-quinone oxidoreductase subunit A [Planctomycetota bacterium]|nr:MAG: NADH-quinone oxidoreductase subunit A [Planctomycetota bacterium]